MKLLLDYGADIEATTSMKRRAIHFAILNGDKKYVDYLVRCGADYNCVDIDKDSPLHYASRLGYTDIVEYLLAKCATISKNIYNETPIDLAVNITVHKVNYTNSDI